MPAKPSEIRAFLLKWAKDKNLIVKEHVSPSWAGGGLTAFYCHVENQVDQKKSATAISYEGHDNALVMAFLNFLDPSLDFLDRSG